jgi:hypothetical protein
MAGDPYPRPPSSRKKRKLSADEQAARIAWKTDGRIPGCDPHHFIDAQVLRHMGFSAYEWDPRNKGWIPREIHAGHTSRMHPIGREQIPASVWDFAGELDLKLGRAYFANWLCKNYSAEELEAA